MVTHLDSLYMQSLAKFPINTRAYPLTDLNFSHTYFKHTASAGFASAELRTQGVGGGEGGGRRGDGGPARGYGYRPGSILTRDGVQKRPEMTRRRHPPHEVFYSHLSRPAVLSQCQGQQ
jgi:hypothetical protein